MSNKETENDHLYPHEGCARCGAVFETVKQRDTHRCPPAADSATPELQAANRRVDSAPNIEAVAREAAEKWFAECDKMLETNRPRTGDSFVDAGHAHLEVATQKLTVIITDTLRASDLYRSGVEDACKELGDLERNEVNFRRGFEAAREAAAEKASTWARQLRSCGPKSAAVAAGAEVLAKEITALNNPTPAEKAKGDR